MAGKYKKKKHKVLKNFGILAAFVLVIGITVVITWALLTATSDTKSNVFCGTEGITLALHEPNWDENTDSSKNGETMAKNYSPNQEIPKDPQLKNTTIQKTGYENDSKEYVALRLTYQIKTKDSSSNDIWETITYEQFTKLADVYMADANGDIVNTAGFNVVQDSDSDDIKKEKWYVKTGTDVETNTIFYYGRPLNGAKDTGTTDSDNKPVYQYDNTNTLFDFVKIANLSSDTLFACNDNSHFQTDTNNTTTITTSNHKGLIGFRIVVEGFAVQAYENGNDIGLEDTKDANDNVTLKGAKTRLDELMEKHKDERPKNGELVKENTTTP